MFTVQENRNAKPDGTNTSYQRVKNSKHDNEPPQSACFTTSDSKYSCSDWLDRLLAPSQNKQETEPESSETEEKSTVERNVNMAPTDQIIIKS